jgi:osmotically-inducible protein OsmY
VVAIVALCFVACSSSQQERAKSDLNDAFIAAQIHTKLAGIDAATVSLVTVDVKSGAVTLTGQVHSESEREKVDQAARSVSGVTVVHDRLKVNPKAPTAAEIADDLSLQAKVKTALAAQIGVNALKVQPTVHAGVVQLDGTFSSAALHEVILETVRGVGGVHRIVDRLRLQRAVPAAA